MVKSFEFLSWLRGTSLTSVSEGTGLIPGLIRWVKELALQ